jgi:hypothetical protein
VTKMDEEVLRLSISLVSMPAAIALVPFDRRLEVSWCMCPVSQSNQTKKSKRNRAIGNGGKNVARFTCRRGHGTVTAGGLSLTIKVGFTSRPRFYRPASVFYFNTTNIGSRELDLSQKSQDAQPRNSATAQAMKPSHLP